MGKIINWTEEQKEWLKENHLKFYDYELAQLFNEKFNTSHPKNTISSFRQRLKLSKPKYKHDGRLLISDKVHYASNEQVEWLKENFSINLSRIELTNKFNERFNTSLNIREIQYICLKNNLMFRKTYNKEEEKWLKENVKNFKDSKKLTEEFNKKFNTTLRNKQLLNKLQTIKCGFLKQNGLKAANELPIGTMSKTNDRGKDRYIIKTKNGWEEAGRYFYKQYYGKIPANSVIFYLDGNTNNFAKENLIAITNSEVGTLRARCTNEKINYFNQGILTKAMVEIIKLEKEINNYE